MSIAKFISLSLLTLLIVGCKPDQPAHGASGNTTSTTTTQVSALKTYDAVSKLEELTDANSAALLLQPDARSVIIAYSSKQNSPLQTEQLEQFLRESHKFTGAVKFYRLDQATYPTAWNNISGGRAWTQGPCFLMVSNSPQMIGTVVETKNGVDVPMHALTADRITAEIARFFKVRLPVTHVDVNNVDQVVAAPGLPTFIMAYRSKGPTNDTAQFQRFVYESQLYAGRVNFVMVDLDQPDLSNKLGIKMPLQDDTYFVVYNPTARDGSMVFDPALSTKGMEAAIRTYFGPGHEPATVIN